ncbi:hypothetical protein QTH49_13520 [Clostridium perfringens]|nr:hypothetical protein [Clostridium perfringens]
MIIKTNLEYELLEDVFGDDEAVCNEILEYSDSTYLCDAISSIADYNVPMIDRDLCEKCWELNDYVAEAKAQGLLEGADDLIQMLRMGAYEYYTQLLYNNLDAIVTNIATDTINEEFDIELTEEQKEELLDFVTEAFENTDHNDTIYDIKEKAIEVMKEFIEELEEE